MSNVKLAHFLRQHSAYKEYNQFQFVLKWEPCGRLLYHYKYDYNDKFLFFHL